MSSRGRSVSPRPLHDDDVDMSDVDRRDTSSAKVVVVTNLTRNVVETHLRTIFGFYGEITKIDIPFFGKSLQNRGKASLEYSSPDAARKAVSHMDGGQLDGNFVKVELSDVPIRRSRSPRAKAVRNGRDRIRSPSSSRSRSPSRGPRRRPLYEPRYGGDSYRGRGTFGRRGPSGRDIYRPHSRSRSRSPIRRDSGRFPPRRRSPSYERGGTGTRRRSRSYSVHSSRSRSRSYSPSRGSRSRSPRSRSRSYSSYSRYSRSVSRGRSLTLSRSRSRARRSSSRDDIRDSRSRSPRSPADDR